SLREKEVLLREIHHRVKNNLQVISSLLNLQSAYIKDKQYAEMLKESQNRIKSMALIHERLYQSETLANIEFSTYVRTLVSGLVCSYGVSADHITLTIDADNVFLDVDAAIPCGLIINELVSNCLKHAFPDRKGEVTVALHSVDGQIELVISDNGVGIPDNIDFKNTETLGLRLVTILAEEQLNGEITLDKSKGTAFIITFRR
ncbi:MAG: ATP-binding protein, partial [Theionarchaea archaeon]|nr:ATP-binding protein [Theionarchaea archaeon]